MPTPHSDASKTTMLAKIKALLFEATPNDAAPSDSDTDGSLSAALLIQAALADGKFSTGERGVIRTILVRDHGASDDEAAALIAEAEIRVNESVQMFGFTSAVNRAFTFEQKVALIETLWEVVLADGMIESHEGALMRRLADLLHIPDRDSAHARQRVEARVESSQPSAV